ncbi:hypothetical protein VNO77_16858 [Canavalia gladiata]|uniref:Uncharacterized protein n=1 Tax=Canavalia gladiata TaxID=3824 RepID=A0AAN9QIU3_CANGL
MWIRGWLTYWISRPGHYSSGADVDQRLVDLLDWQTKETTAEFWGILEYLYPYFDSFPLSDPYPNPVLLFDQILLNLRDIDLEKSGGRNMTDHFIHSIDPGYFQACLQSETRVIIGSGGLGIECSPVISFTVMNQRDILHTLIFYLFMYLQSDEQHKIKQYATAILMTNNEQDAVMRSHSGTAMRKFQLKRNVAIHAPNNNELDDDYQPESSSEEGYASIESEACRIGASGLILANSLKASILPIKISLLLPPKSPLLLLESPR